MGTVIGANPNRMTAADRVTELGQIFVAAIQRVLSRGIQSPAEPTNSADCLAMTAAVEAECGRSTETPQ